MPIISTTTTTPTPLRDDQLHPRSLSHPERHFIRSTILTTTSTPTTPPLRLDGRTLTESRPLHLTFRRSNALSSSTIQFGSTTRATTSISCHLVPPPNPDRPNDGRIHFTVELSPMAGLGWDSSPDDAATTGGRQVLMGNRITRLLEKMIREGGALDAEALCVESGRWVWKLEVNVVILDYGGNVVDVGVMSAMAALCHFRLPVVSFDDAVEDGGGGGGGGVVMPTIHHADERDPLPLPLHHVSLPISFALFGDVTGLTSGGDVVPVMDPNDREEMVCEGLITFCFNVHGELCCLDFPGGCEVTTEILMRCGTVAERKGGELCRVLEQALKEADERAKGERLERIRLGQGRGGAGGEGQQKEMMVVEAFDEIEEAVEKEKRERERREENEEEERYRMQALDYSIGHIAARLKDDDDEKESASKKIKGGGIKKEMASSLMDAMLKSAASASASTPAQRSNDDDSSHMMDIDNDTITTPSTAKKDKNNNNNNSLSSSHKMITEDTTTMQQSSMEDKQSQLQVPLPHDSDDEEDVTILQTEFTKPMTTTTNNADNNNNTSIESNSKKAKTTKEAIPPPSPATNDDNDDDDDVDDLAMAIKKKKGDKKKKKKSKKK